MDTFLREHSYAKALEDTGSCDESHMDTSTPVANADDIIVNVTQLDKTQDTFESLLIELLKSHSLELQGSQQLLPESLKTLSAEQLHGIRTNNYQAIQHLLTIKQDDPLPQTPERIVSVGVVSDVPGHSPLSNNTSNGPIDHASLNSSSGSTISSISDKTSSVDSTTNPSTAKSVPNISLDHGNSATSIAVSSPGAKSPSISIKISPEQLKSLQVQITEMFKQQNLQLPENFTSEQKQMVLNSLIAQHLNATLQQLLPGGIPPVNQRPTNTSNSASSNSSQGGVAVSPSPSSEPASVKSTVSLVAPSSTVGTGVLNSSTAVNSIASSNTSEQLIKEQKNDDSGKKKKDPESKRPPTAFNIFFSEMYPIVQEQQANISFSEASKMVSGLWSGLGQDGKKKYYDKCEQIKNEFNSRAKETPPTNQDPSKSSITDNSVSSNQVSSSTIKPPSATKSTGKKPASNEEKKEGACLQDGCHNVAVYDVNRGSKYCSDECVVNHSKILFHSWVSQRRLKT